MTNIAGVIRTPAAFTVVATCPTCEQVQGIAMQIGAELLVSDDGSELRLKARSKGVAHICDQLPMNLDAPAVDRVLDRVADEVNAGALDGNGITATMTRVGDRLVDRDTGEILEAPESAEERLRRLEREPDYVERIGTDEGQALLEAAGREADDKRRKAARA